MKISWLDCFSGKLIYQNILTQKVSEYDQEIPQSHTTDDQPTAP